MRNFYMKPHEVTILHDYLNSLMLDPDDNEELTIICLKFKMWCYLQDHDKKENQALLDEIEWRRKLAESPLFREEFPVETQV